ncbi:MAG: hypothetical protein ACRDJ9_22995 [Dehalococcoidia bacterium]
MTGALAELSWPILERIPLIGHFAVSPHGITIAIGFIAGAGVMQRRARQRGVARRPVDGVDHIVEALLTRAAIGASSAPASSTSSHASNSSPTR